MEQKHNAFQYNPSHFHLWFSESKKLVKAVKNFYTVIFLNISERSENLSCYEQLCNFLINPSVYKQRFKIFLRRIIFCLLQCCSHPLKSFKQSEPKA